MSYEFLSQLLAEYLLLNSPDVDIAMALNMMPLTTSASSSARLLSILDNDVNSLPF